MVVHLCRCTCKVWRVLQHCCIMLACTCSEVQFRQVAGDFERFQGKWMLQSLPTARTGSASASTSSLDDAEVSLQACCPLGTGTRLEPQVLLATPCRLATHS